MGRTPTLRRRVTTAPGRREAGGRLLELLALTGFVVAQPLFDVMSGSVEFLVFRQVQGLEVVALAALIVLLPPLGLWALGWLVSAASPRAGRITHAAIVAALVALFLAQVLRRVTSGATLAVATVLASAAIVGGYLAWPTARRWLRATAIAPSVLAGLFLFASPVTPIVGSHSGIAVGAPRPGTAPVVLIVLDELPLVSLLEHGEIDARLYPNFAGLAAEATFFRNATSVAARTVHSLPALVTGQLPREPLAPVSSEFPGNLFGVLSASHDVHAFESVTALCPDEVCATSAQPRTSRRALGEDLARLWVRRVWPPKENSLADTFLLYRAGEDQPVRFERFLESIDGRGTSFHFIHLILPHAPWQFLPDGRRYRPEDLGLVSYDQRTAATWPAVVDRQRHILQTMYVDRLLGQAIARLKGVGLFDRAAVVVTADHGISFAAGLEKGTRDLRPENQHEVAWVPLIVKRPGQVAGEVRDDNVMGVDVAPTVADLAGVDIPWHVDGMSLIGDRRRDERKIWFNKPGTNVEIDEAAGFAAVLENALSDLLAVEKGADGAFILRVYESLVGRPANAVATTGGPAAVAHLDRLDAFTALDPGAPVVPSLVTGHLELRPDEPPPATVAFVLNGFVAGASQLYEEGEQRHRFAAVVSPQHVKPGGNTLEVFAAEGVPGRIALRPLRVIG